MIEIIETDPDDERFHIAVELAPNERKTIQFFPSSAFRFMRLVGIGGLLANGILCESITLANCELLLVPTAFVCLFYYSLGHHHICKPGEAIGFTLHNTIDRPASFKFRLAGAELILGLDPKAN